MGFEEIQKEVDEWAKQFDPAYWPALEQLAQLSEEVGEVARVLNRMYGHKKAKTDEEMRQLKEELVDAMFPIICIANREGINLSEAWTKRMQERLYKRDANRFKLKEE